MRTQNRDHAKVTRHPHATWQQISLVLVQAQERVGHGIHLVTPITKKGKKQVGILFVGDTNLWEGLGEDDDIDAVMDKRPE